MGTFDFQNNYNNYSYPMMNFNYGFNQVPFTFGSTGFQTSPYVFDFSGRGSGNSKKSEKPQSYEEYQKQKEQEYQAEREKKKKEELAKGPTDREYKVLSDAFAKSLTPSESLPNTIKGAALFAVPLGAGKVKNALIKGKSGELFKEQLKNNDELKKLYKTTKGRKVIDEAYQTLRKIETKAGKYKNIYTKQEYEQLKNIIKDAIKDPHVNLEEIATATERLNQADSARGWFKMTGKNAWAGTKNIWNRITKKPTVNAPKPDFRTLLDDTTKARTTALKNLASKSSALAMAKRGIKGGIGMAALEIAAGLISDIPTAFSKNSKTGWTQVEQTSIKAAGNAIGWIAGEAAATAAFTKLCTLTGTAIAPGVGTAIGFAVGMIGGTIGTWLIGKATHAMVGNNVSNQVTADNMLKPENNQIDPNNPQSIEQTGKYQLIQNAITMHGRGEADKETERILKKYNYVA